MNRFQAVHVEAAKDKRRKREHYERELQPIWERVFSFLDDDDIYITSEDDNENVTQVIRPLAQIRRRAYHALRSFVHTQEYKDVEGQRIAINGTYARDTEFEALYNLFEQALLKKEWQKLTRTQRETVALVEMSKQTGTRESKFISNVLSITLNAAQKRLRTISEKKSLFTPEFGIIEIKHALETTPRYCPFCAEQGKITRIPNPKNAMCWLHHDRFVRREDFGWYPREDYERLVFKSSAAYWRQVRSTLEETAA